MMQDLIDRLLGQWAERRPDLDPAPMAVAGRILRLAGRLETRVEHTLKPFGLTLWQFDMLATLRRFDEPLPPKRLIHEVMLSSGAMTNRIDRLVATGLVRRRPDPDDRRGVLVELTAKGRRLVDRAIEARFDEARQVTDLLAPRERSQLEDTLRKLLVALESEH